MGLGRSFPHLRHLSSRSQKDPPCEETRRLSHKAWKSVQRFDLGACPKKYRTIKKFTEMLYFSHLETGEKSSQNWVVPKFAMMLSRGQSVNLKLLGVTVLRRIFDFPVDFWMRLTTSSAILRCMWLQKLVNVSHKNKNGDFYKHRETPRRHRSLDHTFYKVRYLSLIHIWRCRRRG